MKFGIDQVIADHYGPNTAATYDKMAYEKFWAYPESLHAVATDIVWSRKSFDNSPTIRILDVGSGTGNLCKTVVEEFLNRRNADEKPISFHITLYDSSTYMLEQATAKLGSLPLDKIKTIVGRIQEGKWESNYDVIISSFAIHHLTGEEKQVCFKRFFDALRPGGVVSILDKMWVDHPKAGVSEEHFLRVAASKFYPMIRQRDPEVTLEGLVEAIREGFVNDGDQPSTVTEHIDWLQQAGFSDIQNSFVSFGHSAVSAQRT